MKMSTRAWSLAAAFVLALAAAAAAQTRVYRIELSAGGVVWSDDAPLQSGEQILFHGRPAGALMSLRRGDVKRIVATTAVTLSSGVVKPGQAVDIGLAGPGKAGGATPRPVSGSSTAPKPGEARSGSALFNPDRAYRPDWDNKLVPGSTMGLPNSPNDYREGRTLAFPSAAATQSAPGEPPTMKPGSGEPPKAPNQ